MNITISNDALKEIHSLAKEQQIRKPLVCLDVLRGCCSSVPTVTVVDQESIEFKAVGNVKGLPIAVAGFAKDLYEKYDKQEGTQLHIDYSYPLGLSFSITRT